MWFEICKFEIGYRFRRTDTYVFFVFLVLFSIVGVDFVFEGADLGSLKKNAPLVIAKTMGIITGIFMVVASMIMGTSVIRDKQFQIEALLYVNPIKKSDYLLGRFLGSFVVLLFIFTGVLLGMPLGEHLPWHRPEDVMTFSFWPYLKSFFAVSLPMLFFGASLFFTTGALSKKLLLVYTQSIVLFLVFLLTTAVENETLQAILDPLSIKTITQVTQFWTILERNTEAIPFVGLLLYNKLFWSILGILCLGYCFYRFRLEPVGDHRSKKMEVRSFREPMVASLKPMIPVVLPQTTIGSQMVQLWRLSWFHFVRICKESSFRILMICAAVIIFVNSINLGTVYGVDSYPTSYFIVEELQETSIYFFIAILLFYSSELVWTERTAQIHSIHDATSISDFVNLLAKYLSLLLLYVVLMLSLIVSGLIFQTLNGYYQYELDVYCSGFFLEIFPFLALYTIVAFFMHSICNHKYAGLLAVLVFFIANQALEMLGFSHPLYHFGGSSLATYSDMNGYGHFLWPYILIKSYWGLLGIVLLIVAAAFVGRGAETGFSRRWKVLRKRFSLPLLKFTAIVGLLFVTFGGFIFYNTNILNRYWSISEENEFRANYEKSLKKFEYRPQPKIIEVNLQVALYPRGRDYTVEGCYVLKNSGKEPITEIHVQKRVDDQITLSALDFDRAAVLDSAYAKFGYYRYLLKAPLECGEVVEMTFKQRYLTTGFEQDNSNTNIVYNGTFIDNESFPTLGYNRRYELREGVVRSDYGLPPRRRKASRDDSRELLNARSGGDSDGIELDMVISTSLHQTAVAPGNLVAEWVEKERRYFHYKMKKPIINFYSLVSAQYQVVSDVWSAGDHCSATPIDLEIYYNGGHEYNLERMMESMKLSFDYYTTNFGPYPYEQLRIAEYPRYAEFAQSFPSLVPFSEAIGFVLEIDDEHDVDMAFYVTAHEVAHQWWGSQVEAANVQGKHMILETLSQYSALMVLRKKYSEKKVRQFLGMQQDIYNKAKNKFKDGEVPLALVENQEYIYYAKGALAMYALQKTIGEENVNRALKRFIEDWSSYGGTLKSEIERYATTEDLLDYFRAVTPDDSQHIITALFETVENTTDYLE